MRNFKLPLLLFVFAGLISCNSEESLLGRKLYALDVKTDAITIAEYELNFISTDKVEMKQMIYCNSFECLTKENSSRRFEKTIIKNYHYKDDFLKIDGIPDLSKVSFLPNGDVKSNTGEILYSISITKLDDRSKGERVTYFLKGDKAFAKVFIGLLYNSAPRPLLEKTDEGKLKLVQIPRFIPPTIIKEKE